MPKPKIRTCKNCKEKFQQKRQNMIVCSPTCAYEYTKKQNEKKARKEKKEAKEKLKGWMDYYQETLKTFNAFIRERDKDQPCISCNKQPGQYRLTSGHYYPQGQNKSVALDEDNAHGQCWNDCNRNKSGNLSEYYPRLIKKIGQQRFDELEQRKNSTAKYSIPELIEIKVHYKNKLKVLQIQNK